MHFLLTGTSEEQGPSAATKLLSELEKLLALERKALATLDRDAIERLATAKLEVNEQLCSAVRQQPLTAADQPLLERIKKEALANQLLLAHARSCVQGVLSVLLPESSPAYRGRARPSAAHGGSCEPVALNLRR